MRQNIRILFLLIISTSVTRVFGTETFIFTVSAEVEKSSVVNLPKEKVKEFISDLSIYPKYFPDIVSVKHLNDSESEWTYMVDAPLASPFYLTFILVEKNTSPDTMILVSKDSIPDFLLCKTNFVSTGDNRTSVKIDFRITMTREKASDIHFLAGILGESFISDRMHDKLEDDLEIFIEKATKDMYKKFK
jgi:uncharacterized membrane protein